jgi:hypothetical protein
MAGDPSTELVKAAAGGTVEALVRTLFAPIVETGEWAADLIRRQRIKTQIRTLEMTQQILDEARLTARVVPPKLLVPLLESASLEENDDMQARWAALLANAAAGETQPEVTPAFVSILAELTPVEATMLEWLDETGSYGRNLDSLMEVAGYDLSSRESAAPYRVYVDNLARLNLIEVNEPDRALLELEEQVITRNRRRLPRFATVQMTALGRAFVAACTPPGVVEG